MLSLLGLSDRGCVRTNNEDYFHVDENLALCILADGMGGHGYGEMAAEIAVETTQRFMAGSEEVLDVTWPFGYEDGRSLEENRLVNAIQLANRCVWRAALEKPEYAGMGSTIVALKVTCHRAIVANVGDSRAYMLRDGALFQLTVDDTASGAGQSSNVLTQAVGSHLELDVHTCDVSLLDGDVLLLASDGLYGSVEPAMVRSILYAQPNVRTTAECLIAAALDAGAADNVTCIVVRNHSEVQREEST